MPRPTSDNLPPITPEVRRRCLLDTFRPRPIPAATLDAEAIADAAPMGDDVQVVARLPFPLNLKDGRAP